MLLPFIKRALPQNCHSEECRRPKKNLPTPPWQTLRYAQGDINIALGDVSVGQSHINVVLGDINVALIDLETMCG